MASFLSAWPPALSGGSRRSHRQAWRRCPPCLEALEDRIVPSTVLVSKSADDVTEPGTLRYAVAHAAGGDTIVLAAGLRTTPIVLSEGELFLDKDLTIRSVGHAAVTVSGGGQSRVF